MPNVFISYRPADAGASAIALRNDLAGVFGEENVHLEKESPWREQIEVQPERCKVVLVVIGSRWLTITDEHNRPRIELRNDLHRQEIAFLLNRSDVTVIPVLVDQAVIPLVDQLPSNLQRLGNHQARSIASAQARRVAAWPRPSGHRHYSQQSRRAVFRRR